jgi:RimJ/RimL family protein N-acetyltransferase
MSTPTVQPELETARLRLRPFRRNDAGAVQCLAGAFEIADVTENVPHPYPDGAAELWIASLQPAWVAGNAMTCAITLRTGGELVGAIGLRLTPDHALGDLGYWIAVPHWNRGYATEAGTALLAFAFGQLGLNRIQSRHLTRNPASGRVMVKLGMRHEGCMRQAVCKWGRFEDIELYARLAADTARI